ncbi:MAG: hypothetical protein L0Y72_28260 [Gemmataceae bacterium]|nr:hypothetical protein [Gemmataceae bacterium]MCI0742941.1 hypothetical protein [Gemmataceae bacterium]
MRFYPVSFILLLFAANVADAQRKEALIIFKDGFYLSGKLMEEKSFITDPVSGASITIPKPNSLVNLDDWVRRTYFIPGQLQDILDKKHIETDEIVLKRYGISTAGGQILPGWLFDSVSAWNDKWERSIKINVTKGPSAGQSFNIDQRIVRLTPQHMFIQAIRYNLDMYHLTKELGPELTLDLLYKYYKLGKKEKTEEKEEQKEKDDKKEKNDVKVLKGKNDKKEKDDKKDLKDPKEKGDKKEKVLEEHEKRFNIAKFMHQAGWSDWAEKELKKLVVLFPEEEKNVAPFLETVKKVQAEFFAETIEQVYKVGQPKHAQARLAYFEKNKMAPLVSEKQMLAVQDVKNKLAANAEKLTAARSSLKALSKRVGKDFWTQALESIERDLNTDTLDRLETFLVFAKQHLGEIAEGKTPSQSTEQVIALAITGWSMGNSAAEPDQKTAQMVWEGRRMVLEYQKTDNTIARGKMLDSYLRQWKDLPIDMLARVIRLLPPPEPADAEKIGTDITKREIELTDGVGGMYLLKLPPDYHHNRQYPVLVLLHSMREGPGILMQRWNDVAVKHGFIMVAPLWAGIKLTTNYSYSAKEHAIVLDTLRDLRRRFQVDSDRVFLYGWEQGADAAWDIGLAHPDQFAGVLPMCGGLRFYPQRCWSNSQYLPLYIVEGERNGTNPGAVRGMFKNWMRGVYPALYVEYKGRGSELYPAEFERMGDWMSRKKRHHPSREMGVYNTGSTVEAEEFKTLRDTDNRFYWLSTDDIQEKYKVEWSDWKKLLNPALLQARISMGNESGAKGARIWSQINIRVRGLNNVTLWLGPHMIDFAKPVRIYVNNFQMGKERIIPPDPATMLDDFHYWGDRQRLFYAKVDMNLSSK